MSTSNIQLLFKGRLAKSAKDRGLDRQQKDLVEAYRLGKLDEKDFQLQLSKDPVLAKWVKQVLEAASNDHLRK
ncbi:hypothetical protein QO004_002933 [Rhizobium mesoamericanum]|uniref:hypothetical protein n=1 Tax=Rhizobium mesoamericanum TaxID=1079800 RepID=UPI002782CC14|nr:hypothetical protein [Rhizobium mesoamericanum]MDQ0561140.1 hypothetical protein [Rhizobium mesoamericanum]